MPLDDSVHGMRLRVMQRAQVLGNVSFVCRRSSSPRRADRVRPVQVPAEVESHGDVLRGVVIEASRMLMMRIERPPQEHCHHRYQPTAGELQRVSTRRPHDAQGIWLTFSPCAPSTRSISSRASSKLILRVSARHEPQAHTLIRCSSRGKT